MLQLIFLAGVIIAPWGWSTEWQGLDFELPDGFEKVQEGGGNQPFILFQSPEVSLTLYRNVRLDSAEGETVLHRSSVTTGDATWLVRDLFESRILTTTHSDAFYSIVVTGSTRALIEDISEEFISTIRISPEQRSLTGEDYFGRKFYLGWGAALGDDPKNMQNEVKYDVLHTHDIFTDAVGGNYLGFKWIGPETKAMDIRDAWKRLSYQMTAEDMYVQYSSGHGSYSGLLLGLKYEEIRDQILALPGKELVVFTMACYSGNLVESFNRRRNIWEGWKRAGRTLFVMSSSEAGQTSSTGPGLDQDEPHGVKGSAGSAFGHALWKALLGHADGVLNGIRDGFLSLGEIEKYTIQRTVKLGNHTPQVTGSYDKNLIMNRVPPKPWVDRMEREMESISEKDILKRLGMEQC